MKAFFVLLLAVLAAAQYSKECQYVNDTRFLTDVAKVKKCFNTYQLEKIVLDTVIHNLEIVKEIYPYVEIAANPPSEPAGYFNRIDYAAGLEDLKAQFKKSNGVISKVVRPALKFVNGFRDGHFSLTFYDGAFFENLFYYVYFAAPFEIEVAVDGDVRNVTINPSRLTNYFINNGTEILQEKVDAGVIAVKVDDKDPFDFFTTFLGEYNDMKSEQGRRFYSMRVIEGCPYLYYPVETAFDKHVIEFSDGSKLDFYFGFVNVNAPQDGLRDDVLPKKLVKPAMMADESPAHDKEVLNVFKNIEALKKEKGQKREDHQFFKCGLIDDMNYITIPTFSPDPTAAATLELLDCVQEFDENDKPITIVFPYNGGGSAAFRELIEFLLMPGADARSLRAARKTPTTRFIAVDNGGIYVSNASKNCEALTPYETKLFWRQEENDTFGEAIHTRTKKFFECFESSFDYIAKYRLQKHVRKPTEIIIATDGFCFSACSFFVYNCIRSGSAIVAGYGATARGDEQFVASQCPSRVITPSAYFSDLYDLNELVGIDVRSTFLESYNVSAKLDEKIPADYDILRIDKHCGYYKNFDPDTEELLQHTKAVYEEFKTKCNPANKRLFLVTENCTSKDPNALYSGYVCGSNGEWDTKTCKISSCKPGYSVDFDNNKCVRNPCDPRMPYVPAQSSSSEKPVPVSSSVSASNTLYPMIGMIATAIVIAIHHLL